MTKFGKILIFSVVAATLVAAIFLVWFFNTTKKIATYEECIKAGWLVRSRSIADGLPLFPNKYGCLLWSGKSFEKYEEKQEIFKDNKDMIIDSVNFINLTLSTKEVKELISSASINESERQEWKSYTSEKLGISFIYPPDHLVVESEEIRIFEDSPYNRNVEKILNPDFDYVIPDDQKNPDFEPWSQIIAFSKPIEGGFTRDITEWFKENKSEKFADRNVYAPADFMGMDAVVYRAEGLFIFDGLFFEREGVLYQFGVQYSNSPESPRDNFYKIISTVEFQQND